jgi:hypothetical protein
VTKVIVTRRRVDYKSFSFDDWERYAREWLELCRGLAGASEREAVVGFIGDYKPVYILPGEVLEGETLYAWLVFEGEGKAARVVNKLLEGVYADAQDGTIYEHPAEWVLELGSVSRIGSEPLLTLDMLRGA